MKLPNEIQAWSKIFIIKMTHWNLLENIILHSYWFTMTENWDTLERRLALENWIATKQQSSAKEKQTWKKRLQKIHQKPIWKIKIAKSANLSHEWVFTGVRYTLTTFSEDTGWSNNGPLSIAVSSFLFLSLRDPSSLHVFFGLGFLIYFI